MPPTPSPTPPADPARPSRDDPPPGPGAEIALRVAGAVVALAGAFAAAAYGAFLTPYRVGTALVPLSLLIAVGGNVMLSWFAWSTTRSRVIAILPGLVWVALSFVASGRTTEGDLILTGNNWVATVYLLAGSLTVGACAYRLFIPSRQPFVANSQPPPSSRG